MEIEIKTLEGVSENQVRIAFNTAFRTYFLPLQMDEMQFRNKLYTEDISLDLSVGAFHDGELVAFILQGLREVYGEQVLFNAGTGVIPAFRGRRLTCRLYAFMKSHFQQMRVDRLQLEVITENLPAISAYREAGFQTRRSLRAFKGSLPIQPAVIIPEEVATDTFEPDQDFWNFRPSWQFDTPSVKKHGAVRTLVATKEKLLTGYIQFNPGTRRIFQLAVAPGSRRQGIGSALLGQLRSFAEEWSVFNVDPSDHETIAFFEHFGWENFLNQFEMVYFPERPDNLRNCSHC